MITDVEKNLVIGVDIGGTGTKIGIVDARGDILARDEGIATGAYSDFEDFVDAINTVIGRMVTATGSEGRIRGIGVGAPDSNYYTGNIEHAFNLPWKGVLPLADMLSQKSGIPVQVTNDANAAAIGEMTYGTAKGMRNFIVITLGTGVGSGIVINGQLVYGCDGFAGELGHVTMVRGDEGRMCGCGRRGCLEAYCSATGVARTAAEMLQKVGEPSMLRTLDNITSRDVYAAAMGGDRIALEIFEKTGTMLGEALADFIAFSSPEAIILFGGLTRAGDLLLDPVKRAVDKNVLHTFKGKTKILISNLKDSDAAILGASALAWESNLPV
ncbi:MAG: ROK family protein [Bacteroidaceae bacterium]|nr:ROK family protein [Bacteroidaceae bacterium]MBQ6694404.1 ROK family protein [Bacteroidaceae bacterium]MBR7166978.1 ROK family protein [Bacteroidaceae bacterium]